MAARPTSARLMALATVGRTASYTTIGDTTPQPSEDAYVAAELALLSLLEGSLVGLSGKRPFLPTEVAPSMAAARAAALCMGRFVAALLEEDAEWLTWI